MDRFTESATTRPKELKPSGGMQGFGKYLRNNYSLYLMLTPMLLFFIIFMYKPMPGLVIAFKDFSPFKGIWDSPWVGFDHFIEFLTGP